MDPRTLIVIVVPSCIVAIGLFGLMLYHISWSCLRSTFTNRNQVQKRSTTTFMFKLQKYAFLSLIIAINAVAIFVVYAYGEFKGIAIILIILKSKDILCAVVLPLYFMVAGVRKLINKITQEDTTPNGSIASIVPVYDEPIDDIITTIDSIIENETDGMNNLVCVVSDGKKCKEDLMCLFDTVIHTSDSWSITSWTNFNIQTSVVFGTRKNKPTMLIVKNINAGKRDTIILAFDIFNHIRSNALDNTVQLRTFIRSFIKTSYGLDTFDYMFFTDADTTISKGSLVKLAKEIVSRKAIACCGLVAVDFNGSPYNFWNVYQNFQYMFGQFLRRSVENLLGKVTCLPGCITMFKVDEVASSVIEKYGELANDNNMVDSMVQNIGTDRRLTSLFLYSGKSIRTTCQLNAIAYTKPPTTLVRFIRQRRRWAGNTYFNTLMNILAPNMSIIIRLFCVLDILKLSFVYFRLFNISMFIYQLVTNIKVTTFIAQVIVVFWPAAYFFVFSLCIPVLVKQYHKLLIGYAFNKVLAGILANATSTVMLFNIGNYSWTKNVEIELSTVIVRSIE
jgi:cellulose synthase/poly-beta-1,6-N-acetylglucosamine synthase-like glycosyltransferase